MAVSRYKSEGQLSYSFDPRSNEPKLSLSVEPGIAETYRALVPKSYRLQRPKFPPHISVIRKEAVPNMSLWGAHEGEYVAFEYEPVIYNDELYYWLRCYSPRLTHVRRELGLPDLSEFARGPDLFDSFHCTIGNCK